MRYAEYPPSPALAGVVDCYWVLEGDGTGVPDPILPDGRVEIILHYGVRFERHLPSGRIELQDRSFVVGQMLAPACIGHRGRAGVAAVRLRPAAIGGVLGCEASEITGRFVDLDALFGRTDTLRERLALAAGDAHRVRLLEEWMAARVCAAPPRDMTAAVATIVAHGGSVDLSRLASDCGISLRQLERRFLAGVGVTPKVFARLVRLQAALRRISAGDPLADVAHACGYFDQPHMARDFSRLAETSPSAWQAHAGSLAPLFVGR